MHFVCLFLSSLLKMHGPKNKTKFLVNTCTHLCLCCTFPYQEEREREREREKCLRITSILLDSTKNFLKPRIIAQNNKTKFVSRIRNLCRSEILTLRQHDRLSQCAPDMDARVQVSLAFFGGGRGKGFRLT